MNQRICKERKSDGRKTGASKEKKDKSRRLTEKRRIWLGNWIAWVVSPWQAERKKWHVVFDVVRGGVVGRSLAWQKGACECLAW